MTYVDDAVTQRANLGFIRASMREPLLSRELEFELAQRWRERKDTAALHALVKAYTRLVISAAGKFRQYGLPIGDLVQEGNVGLMQAAARFEPDRDVRFSTYAAWWIRASMQDYVLRNWSIVRTGTTAAQKTLFFNLRRLRSKIERETGQVLDDTGRLRIASELKVDIDDVQEMEQRLSMNDQSLNLSLSPDGEQDWQTLLPDTRPDPEETVMMIHDTRTRHRWLGLALDELSPRERRIIAERRLRDCGATLEELGTRLGISKERVRQLETRALTKLRDFLTRQVTCREDMLHS